MVGPSKLRALVALLSMLLLEEQEQCQCFRKKKEENIYISTPTRCFLSLVVLLFLPEVHLRPCYSVQYTRVVGADCCNAAPSLDINILYFLCLSFPFVLSPLPSSRQQ